MLAAPFIIVPLTTVLVLAALFSLVRVLTPLPWTARANSLLTALMSLALVAVALRWNPGTVAPLIWVFGAAALWFVLQAALHRQPRLPGTDPGMDGCLYRAALLGLTAWILATASAETGTGAPPHSLGYILTHLIAAIVLVFTAAAWLLATFAMPRQDTNAAPVKRLRGIHETLIAAGMTATLFAML